MEGIEVLVREHDNISRFLDLLELACLNILDRAYVDQEFFQDGIDFIRNYADKIHHGKEEDFLFRAIQDQLGVLGRNLIDHGMLVEHDLARYNLLKLEEALARYREEESSKNRLAIITYAMAYRDLLVRHIDKENRLVYTYAEKNLDPASLREISKRTLAFEKENRQLVQKYIDILEKYEEKYS